MVKVIGGNFMMGRSNAPDYFLNESPGHQVTVISFSIDKTEVTTSAYAECVRNQSCARPPTWSTDSAPEGQEQLPVANVSVDDAQAFAVWRSKRDGVDCRLPTEQEWEYAARSGNNNYLYPWGNKWSDGFANVATKAPAPVGSYSQGASTDGVLDMIGNVWEWTSSTASIYPGNRELSVGAGEEGYYVVRGGYYGSTPNGDEAATATRRKWVPATTKKDYLGFRLVTPE